MVTRPAALVALAGLVLACAACTKVEVPPAPSATTAAPTGVLSQSPSSSGEPTGTATTTPSESPSPTVSATAVPGGVLRLVAGRDAGGFDTITASPAAQNILRGLSRQLVSYKPGGQFTDVVGRVVADAAVAVPLPVGGTSYTFTIRDGVLWNLPTPRPVTSADFARGIKRQCNPVDGSHTATYFADTVMGFAEFCAGFGRLGAKATAAQLKSYLEGHPVSGLATPDATTLVVTLTSAAGDFLNMMALTGASAVPIESLAYRPGSPALTRHLVSDGPYTVASYSPGKTMTLVRNPTWTAASDPLRAANVDGVQIAFGEDEASAQAAVEGGAADFATDLAVAPAALDALVGDKRVESVTDGSSVHLVFNTRSAVARGALGDVAVRQALNIATDKARVIQLSGGAAVAEPLNTVLTPQLLGYRPTVMYVTPGSAGDAQRAAQLLSVAGFRSGFPLRLVYAAGDRDRAIAEAVRDAWRLAGVTVTLTGVDSAALAQLMSRPAGAQAQWDVLLAPPWRPDWYGTAARTFFSPLLRTGAPLNAGGYSNAVVDTLIKEGLAEPDGNRAADVWAQVDLAIMHDAPWVPLFTGKRSYLHAERVNGWAWDQLGLPDYTSVWLRAG